MDLVADGVPGLAFVSAEDAHTYAKGHITAFDLPEDGAPTQIAVGSPYDEPYGVGPLLAVGADPTSGTERLAVGFYNRIVFGPGGPERLVATGGQYRTTATSFGA